MIWVMRAGLARMSSRSAIFAMISLYSPIILSDSRLVRRGSCISRMRFAWISGRGLVSAGRPNPGAAGDNFAAVAQEGVEHLPQVKQPRLAFDQRHHVHAEGVLHLRLLVQIVDRKSTRLNSRHT